MEAHATVVASQPQSGQRLSSTPGIVNLQFSEQLNTALSHAAVSTPDGGTFQSTGSTEAGMQIPLPVNAPGVYRVSWTTVSAVDGHVLHGGFEFGVGVRPNASGEAANDQPSITELALATARWVEFLALLLAIGMLLLTRLGRNQPSLEWVQMRPALPLAAALVAGSVVVIGESLTAGRSPSLADVAAYLSNGPAGYARVLRLGAELVALLLAAEGGPGAIVAVGVALIGLAGAGHAAAVRPAFVGVLVDALHLFAAGIWAGGILALAGLRPPGGWLGVEGRRLLDRFSSPALTAFAITVATGLLQAAEEVGDVGRLLSTSYGIVLMAKSLGVAAMVALSLRAWRRLRVSLRLEALYAIVVVGASALLAAYPLPPARAAEADALAENPAASQALPQAGDLTLGGSAGETLVGLTLRPGKPGPNVAWIYLLPVENPATIPRADVSVHLDGRPVASRRCGLTCQSAALELKGGESLTIKLSGRADGEASFQIPDLPSADGSVLVERASQRMQELRTYRIDETLGPAAQPLRTLYAFQAPDRLRFQLSTGPETVIVGGRRFSRDRPSQAWRGEPALPVQVPSLAWEPASVLGAHVIDSAQLAGHTTQVVAFFQMVTGSPVWFRLWVDEEGLVWRAQMRAQGHFMDDNYRDFDVPLTIEPPLPGGG